MRFWGIALRKKRCHGKKAGEFAKNFSNEFISKGEAVWLDVDVLREVEKFEAKINASLRLLQAPEWSGFYWSSTGFYPNFVWYVFFGRGTQDAMKEWDCCKIRPIIRYKVK